MEYIKESQRDIKVIQHVDLCIIGGSCTGLFAAVRAARLGISVAVVEKLNCFGGTATAGLVNVWHTLMDTDNKNQIISGLTEEVIDRLKIVGAITEKQVKSSWDLDTYQLNTEELKIELDRLVIESKITPYLHTYYCGPIAETDTINGIIIENKDGRQAIMANFFIDASGDGDLAKHLGLKNYTHSHIQPPTPCFKIGGDIEGVDVSKILQEYGSEFGLPDDWGWSGPIPGLPGVSFRADTHVFNVDCSSAVQLTKAEIEGRRQIRAVMDAIRKYSPKGNKLAVASINSHIGVRETRHFESMFQIKGKELIYGTKYEDAVANGTYPIDIHHSDSAGITFRNLNGYENIHSDRTSPPIRRKWREDNSYAPFYQVPFRVLLQNQYRNFIAVGRMINADQDAYGAIRVMVNLNQLGEAAGVAAYLALNSNTAVTGVNSDKLRKTMADGGSCIV